MLDLPINCRDSKSIKTHYASYDWHFQFHNLLPHHYHIEVFHCSMSKVFVRRLLLWLYFVIEKLPITRIGRYEVVSSTLNVAFPAYEMSFRFLKDKKFHLDSIT